MRVLFIVSLLFLSCSTYQHSSYKVKSVLAITEAGDTVSVPIRQFELNKYDNYTRFNYNNNWYYNSWRYDFNWQWNPGFFSYPDIYWWNNNLRNTVPSRDYRTPSRPKVQPKRKPRVDNHRPRVPISTPRGSRSYVRPNNNPNRNNNAVNAPRKVQSNYNTGRKNNN